MRVADTRLYFDVAGLGLIPDGPVMRERPVILCLHGGPGFDHSTLKPYLTPLAQDAQVIFLDHRGQGRSDPSSPERWNLDTWIEDVRGFVDALGIERPVILGQSFGGVVALGIAIRHPELPSRLIVSSSIAKFRLDRALPMFQTLGGERAREVAERYVTDPTQEHLEEFIADHEDMAARIPGSRLEIFSDAGHDVFRDKATEGLSVISEFALAGQPNQGHLKRMM